MLIKEEFKTDKKINCWIVSSDDFEVRKVLAVFNEKRSIWSYYIKDRKGTGMSSWSGLSPYYPTWGNGNWAWSGHGPKFTTKREAKIERVRILKKEAQFEIKRLKEKLKELRKFLKREVSKK